MGGFSKVDGALDRLGIKHKVARNDAEPVAQTVYLKLVASLADPIERPFFTRDECAYLFDLVRGQVREMTGLRDAVRAVDAVRVALLTDPAFENLDAQPVVAQHVMSALGALDMAKASLALAEIARDRAANGDRQAMCPMCKREHAPGWEKCVCGYAR